MGCRIKWKGASTTTGWVGACYPKLRNSDAKDEFELHHKLYAWVEVTAQEDWGKAQRHQ